MSVGIRSHSKWEILMKCKYLNFLFTNHLHPLETELNMNTSLRPILRTSTVCCSWISSWWGEPPPGRWWCRRDVASGRWAPRRPGSDPPRHPMTGPTTAQTSSSGDPETCRSGSSLMETLELCGVTRRINTTFQPKVETCPLTPRKYSLHFIRHLISLDSNCVSDVRRLRAKIKAYENPYLAICNVLKLTIKRSNLSGYCLITLQDWLFWENKSTSAGPDQPTLKRHIQVTHFCISTSIAEYQTFTLDLKRERVLMHYYNKWIKSTRCSLLKSKNRFWQTAVVSEENTLRDVLL